MNEDIDHSQEKSLKIANPERIERILNKICAARLEVLIRLPGVKGLAIKGKCAGVDSVHTPNAKLRISDVSAQGMLHLNGAQNVRVEFVGMATQVLFDTVITTRSSNIVTVNRPNVLVSLERRQNARFQATQEHCSFLVLSSWKAVINEITSPPIVPPYADLASWINIADISEGGFCASTRFPSVINNIRREQIDDRAAVIFPMQPKIAAKVQIRWFKRLKERIATNGEERQFKSFRFGLQFVDPSDELRLAVKQYIQQLTLAEAV